MSVHASTYDLVLILDPQADEAVRAKIAADTESAIGGRGELLRHDRWGERQLSYPIERRASGDYHLFQFHPASPELLSDLDRTLRITDGLLRFRIIKLRPGVPDAPDMGSAPVARRAEPEAPPAPAAQAQQVPAPAEQAAPAEQEQGVSGLDADVAVGDPA